MLLSELTVSNVRNIHNARLQLHPKFNFIIGANGAGKSSFLEALSVLSTSKSFRTRQLAKVIMSDSDSLLITCKGNNNDLEFFVGIRRFRRGGFEAKCNGERVNQLAKITQLLPIIGVYPGFYERVAEKRIERLKLLDWSLFHVEHSYFKYWQQYNKVLKQRNALLKQIKAKQAQTTDLSYWDKLLVNASFPIIEYRNVMVKNLNVFFQEYVSEFQLDGMTPSLTAISGIKPDELFEETLVKTKQQDIMRGFTGYGPHKADIKVKLQKKLFFDIASRGQQKLAINAIVLAIVKMFNSSTQRSSLVFIDDLPSELDDRSQSQLLSALASLDDTQILISAINQDSLPESISGYNKQMFHVKHGVFQAMD